MNFVQWVTVIVYSLASVKNYIYKILHSLSPQYSKYDLLSHNISNMHFLKTHTHTPKQWKKVPTTKKAQISWRADLGYTVGAYGYTSM